jgi:hypothetical protein
MRPYMLLWLLVDGNLNPLHGLPAHHQVVEAGGAEVAPDDALPAAFLALVETCGQG